MTTRAVFLDALGTIVELEPPWIHLAAALGIESDERVEAAFRAEMAFYREHTDEGRDEASLADLRARSARVLSTALGREVPVATMLAAIRFRAYPDAAPALAELRRLGVTLICVSNWDVSLEGVLRETGLRDRLDGLVCSAAVGFRKPDPRIFATALGLAKCAPDEAIHVGDTMAEDGAGAAAAGIPFLSIDRDDESRDALSSLAEIADHLRP